MSADDPQSPTEDTALAEMKSHEGNPADETTPTVIEDASTHASTDGDDGPAPSESQVGGKEISAAPVKTGPTRSTGFVYDPNKIILKFIFANRDGISVILDCKPSDVVGEVKGALLSLWPKEMPECSGEDRIRLICMGKGMLTPDSKTLDSFQIPIFKTHPTPVNVSVRPDNIEIKKGSPKKNIAGSPSRTGGGSTGASTGRESNQASTGCSCIIL